MELVTNPEILFLDEPTSGLDSATAIKITHVLSGLADNGCNIIMSIHQPRYGIYKLFTNLLLLSRGSVVYQGPPDLALQYFNSLGYHCEMHNNPADFFLDTIEHNEETAKNESFDRLLDAYQKSANCQNVKNQLNSIEKCSSLDKRTKDFEMTQGLNNSFVKAIKDRVKDFKFYKKSSRNLFRVGIEPTTAHGYKTNFCHQLRIVGTRTIVHYFRNPQIIISQMIIMLIYLLFLGWLYFRINHSKEYGLQNRIGVLFFIMMNQVFGSMTAINIFAAEKITYLYEISGGFYRVSVYFLTKILGDLIILKFISITILSIVGYWMIGFKPDVGSYFTFIATLVFLSAASSAVAFFCSVSIADNHVANDTCSLIYVFMMVFGGLFVNLQSIPQVIRWFKYISLFHYAYNAFLINELRGQAFCSKYPLAQRQEVNSTYKLNPQNFTQECLYGNDYLRTQGIPFKTPWDLWVNHIALTCITACFWIWTYINLRRMKHF